MENETVAQRLEKHMVRAGIKARPLAEKAKVGQTFVRDILKGRSRRPDREKLTRVATVLGCQLGDLTGDIRDGVSVSPSLKKSEESLGARLRALRLQSDLSLDQLAATIQVERGHLAEIEANCELPSWLLICRLADFYNVSIDSFRTTEPVPMLQSTYQIVHDPLELKVVRALRLMDENEREVFFGEAARFSPRLPSGRKIV